MVKERHPLAAHRRQAVIWMANAGLMKQKEALLMGYKAKSLLDLNEEQLNDLANRMKAIAAERQANEVSHEMRKKRSELLSNLARIGIVAVDNDWVRVNKFLLQNKIAGKILYEMTCVKVRIIARENLANKQKLEWKQQNN
jgi:hypothetical protein